MILHNDVRFDWLVGNTCMSVYQVELKKSGVNLEVKNHHFPSLVELSLRNIL